MSSWIFLRAAGKVLHWFCWTLIALGAGHVQAQAQTMPVAEMRGFCGVPPLPGFTVKPNLLLMIDNSASMFDPAYRKPAQYCLDDAADTFVTTSEKNESYLGYFEPASFYRYVTVKDASGNEAGHFERIGDAIPNSAKCNAIDAGSETIAKHVCVSISSGKVDNFMASGSFLNWLTMSKLDIEKFALTGGKYDPATGMLQGETRGCQGKRFIKMLGESNLTFAVRGPVPAEGDYLYQGSMGGMTRIEIYPARYKRDACLGAVDAWQTGTIEQLKAQTDICMGNSYDPMGIPSQGTVFNHAMADCYSYQASSPRDEAILDDPQLFNDCVLRIRKVYGGRVWDIPVGRGEDVCGIDIQHRLMLHPNWNSSAGYLGECYIPQLRRMEPQCAAVQMQDYCSEMINPTLTDPSAVALKAGTNASVPGYILDAGIYDLGGLAATLLARVAVATPPEGLIQEFGDVINFGAMVFNHNGSGSECGDATSSIPCPKFCQFDPAPQKACYSDNDCVNRSAGACTNSPKTDGGKIVSYLNHSSMGSHQPGSGLIASVDAVSAQSWTPLAEAFYEAIGYFANRSDFRLQESDFDLSLAPSKYSCQTNNVLIVSDGMSTTDRAQAVRTFVAQAVASWVNGNDGMPASKTTTGTTAADPPHQGSYNLDDLAWVARNRNITDFNKALQARRDYISTYVVYTGDPCVGCTDGDEAVPEKMMELVASKGGGKMQSAQDPKALIDALRNMLQLISTGMNSTSDSSILSTGSGNSALFLQEQFYRSKSFDGGATFASWIGEMQGLWYFIDPFIASNGGASAIREDTGGLKELDLERNHVVRYVFDQDSRQTLAQLLKDKNGDGSAEAVQPSGYPVLVSPDAVQSLWRAGRTLWQTDAAARKIYTQADGKNLIGFTSNASVTSFLNPSKASVQELLQANGEADAASIISFVQGSDGASTRDRRIAIGGSEKREWKLGDIISSTPVLQTAVSLGSYHLPPPRGYGDGTYSDFILEKKAYRQRGTVYVGANDGMLHAFNLGKLRHGPEDGEKAWLPTKKAVLEKGDEKGTEIVPEIGEEKWAFVPKNALPYLRYLREPNYPHLYYVDGSSTIADVSIGDPATCGQNHYWDCPKSASSWRTVLIGSMGLGGASRAAGSICQEGASGTCVKAPLTDAGLSSYFALDVTGETVNSTTPPGFLWEFSHPKLGYSTSGAAIIRINVQSGNPAEDDHDKNGRWFAVFASGPIGPLDPASCQFLGRSDQNLKIFVVDLNASPPFVAGQNYWVIDTQITNAFGGNISRAGIDVDKWKSSGDGRYEDNALYVGYSKQLADGSWTGGVLRVLTGENADPGQWKTSKVIDGIGPVTGGVTMLQDRGKKALWLYFGTGRHFHFNDDLTAPRAVFGVKEPCYDKESNELSEETVFEGRKCTLVPHTLSDLKNMTADPEDEIPPVPVGWWIGLDGHGDGLASERFTASPTPLAGGAVFFTTFQPPYEDVCRQASSYLWGVAYDTGGPISGLVQGKALVPLSNGSSSEFLVSGLTERGSRRSLGMTGKPGGVKLITNSGLKPIKKIIHIQEQ